MANPVSTELRRMDPGTLWPWVWAYEDRLTALGDTPQSVARRMMSAHHVTVWLSQSRIVPTEIDDAMVGQFLHHPCQCFASRSVTNSIALTLTRGRFGAPDKLMAMLKGVGKPQILCDAIYR